MLRISITFLLISIHALASAQKAGRFSISGKIVSANSDKPISGASVNINKTIGTTSDTAGKFVIRGLQQGKHKLSFRSLDYHKKDTVITIENQSIRDIVLTAIPDCKSFNRNEAIKDVKQGNAFLFVNAQINQSDQSANNQFKEKYGIAFKFKDFGLPAEDCMKIYNETIFKYLDGKFGKQWRNEIKVNAVGFR